MGGSSYTNIEEKNTNTNTDTDTDKDTKTNINTNTKNTFLEIMEEVIRPRQPTVSLMSLAAYMILFNRYSGLNTEY